MCFGVGAGSRRSYPGDPSSDGDRGRHGTRCAARIPDPCAPAEATPCTIVKWHALAGRGRFLGSLRWRWPWPLALSRRRRAMRAVTEAAAHIRQWRGARPAAAGRRPPGQVTQSRRRRRWFSPAPTHPSARRRCVQHTGLTGCRTTSRRLYNVVTGPLQWQSRSMSIECPERPRCDLNVPLAMSPSEPAGRSTPMRQVLRRCRSKSDLRATALTCRHDWP